MKKYVTPFVGVWIETKYCLWDMLSHERHTLRGCVDWNAKDLEPSALHTASHPSWVCGLKQVRRSCYTIWCCHTLRGCVDWNCLCLSLWLVVWVTPFVGVWIETLVLFYNLTTSLSHPSWVCGLKLKVTCKNAARCMSHPSWVCGLKLPFAENKIPFFGHTLRGCVDWNGLGRTRPLSPMSHTLRGCVDWNQPVPNHTI